MWRASSVELALMLAAAVSLLGCSRRGSTQVLDGAIDQNHLGSDGRDGGNVQDVAIGDGRDDATTNPQPDAECRIDKLPNTRICCGQPDDRPGINCSNRDDIERNLANCVREGEYLDARFVHFGKLCCEGLQMAEGLYPTDAGSSSEPGIPAGCASVSPLQNVKVCAKCGDGVCGPGENRCNCLSDCASS
jgi:hypothetical protein